MALPAVRVATANRAGLVYRLLSAARAPKKNLCDGLLETGSYFTSTGNPAVAADKIRNVNAIPIKPNTAYMLSNNKGYLDDIVFWYDFNKAYLSHIVYTESGVTSPINAYYAKFRYTGTDLTAKVQFEEGTAVTAYEPYLLINKPSVR